MTISRRSFEHELSPKFVLVFDESSEGVFRGDDCTIYDKPEIERAKAHQVGADLGLDHSGHGKKHRQRNDQSSD